MRNLRPTLINVVVAAVVALAAIATGTADATNAALVVMGFDADRAQLISSLLVGGVAAAAATLAANSSRQATLAGLAVFAALFGPTFLTETGNALAATGIDGSFDFAGWLLTLLTLTAAGVISGWAGVSLAMSVRPGLVEAGSAIRDAVATRHPDRRLVRQPLALAIVLLLLVVTVPVFGDLVNYTPDARMLHGGPPPVGLVPDVPSSSLTPPVGPPSPSLTKGPIANSSPGPTRPSSSTPPPPTASPDPQPWLAWLPSGLGTVTVVQLPAPWTGGSTTTDDIGIYTPPGYDPKGSRRYPVLYEAPTSFDFWDSATSVRTALDALIDRGQIPATIVVFVDSGSGPYLVSECANSVDGVEHMDDFISRTAVQYVDSHYLTIAQANARAITGMSQGGYCAAILALRHPTVFGTSIPFSGYYQAGAAGANSRLPFGGDAAALAAASPTVVATQLPVDQRQNLFLIVIAEPSQPFYGPQATAFESLLTANGYPYVALNAQVPHGWVQVRQEFPAALEAWAAHLVAVGAF
jgi:hypothetical protein